MASQALDVDLDTDNAFYALHHFVFKYDTMRKGTSLSIPRHDISDHLGFLKDIPELLSTPDSNARADRVRRLLDAFVKICQRHTGDIFALSMGLRPSTDTTGTPEKLILTIAGNDTPPIGLKDYLGSIWTRLQQISLLEKEARAKGNHPDAPGSNTGDSPLAVRFAIEAQSSLIKGLHHDIHSFCFGKTKSRLTDFEKKWNKFYPFYLETSQTTIIGESSKVQSLLSTVCHALNIILNRLEECTSEFVEAQSDLWHAYWKLARLGPGYEDDWYDELDCVEEFCVQSGMQFSLTQIILQAKKLTAHINTLLAMAYSPRLRPWLECELDVNLLNSGPQRLPFPTTSYLEACIRKMAATANLSAVYNQHAVEEDEEHRAINIEELLSAMPTVLLKINKCENKLNRKTPAKLRLHDPDSTDEKNVRLQQMNPHAECTLLAYLHESSESGIRRFSYIAVTKLSCFSCWLLFEAYCKHQKHCFRLRGCHSDPSHPWVIPDFKDHKLEEACRKHILNDRIIKLFVLNLKQGGRLSKGRHSSDSGTGPNDLHQPDG